MTDYKQLCAEFVGAVDRLLSQGESPVNPGQRLILTVHVEDLGALADRARAALAEPEPEGLTDEELLCIAAKSIEPYDQILPGEYEPESNCAVEVYGSELIIYARAVLARCGNPAPTLQPRPVDAHPS